MISRFHRFTSVQLVLAVGVSFVLGGCANWFTPIGSNKYDCNRKENPDSPFCHSFKSVEKATSNDIPQTRYDQNMSIGEVDKLTGIAPINNKQSDQSGGTTVPSPNKATADQKTPFSCMSCEPGYALPAGTPVRVGPVVQRVWIKSFNDQNDMLTSDQIVYKEVVPTHWAGQPTSQNAQGVTAGGLPAAYPHKPDIPSTPLINTNHSTTAEKKDFNTDFTQPGTQLPVNDTVPKPSDNGFKSMPQ